MVVSRVLLFCMLILHFLSAVIVARRMHSAACAVLRCPSVRLPVSPIVMFMYCIEMSKHILGTVSPAGRTAF